MDGSPVEGCITPCLEGNPGYRDGPFKFSKFQYPYNIAIQIDSGNKSLSKLIVTDRHFIRQLDLSSHQVTTIAGQLTEGESDGQVCRIVFYLKLFKKTLITCTSSIVGGRVILPSAKWCCCHIGWCNLCVRLCILQNTSSVASQQSSASFDMW